METQPPKGHVPSLAKVAAALELQGEETSEMTFPNHQTMPGEGSLVLASLEAHVLLADVDLGFHLNRIFQAAS